VKRTILLPIFLALPLWAASIDVESIAEKLEKVGAWRLPVTPDYVIYDPFKRAEPLIKQAKAANFEPQTPALRVTAVMNERAFVNGRWVKRGDRIGPYRIVSVRSDGVVAKEGGRTLFLPLKRKRKLLHIKETER